MKNLIRSFIACAVMFLVIAAPVQAQGKQLSVTAGSIELKFEANFLSYLQAQGITVTFRDKDNDGGQCRITGGDLDTKTGAGDVHCGAKIRLTSGAMLVDLESLILDTAIPAYPHISALIIVNGVYAGRHPIFTIVSGMPYKLPLKAGDFKSSVGFFKGLHYLDYFQIAKPDPNMLMGSFTVSATAVADPD